MANDAFTQAALAGDPRFRNRVKGNLSTVAWTVINEDPATPNHVNRLNYASQVTRQLELEVTVILPSFVMRPNVFSFATTHEYDFPSQSGEVVSASGDPDMQAQLQSDWNAMAAAAGYKA